MITENQQWTMTIWGVRGSVPMAAAEYMEYGGNTSCMSLNCGSELVVFDAGTGIIPLGEALAGQGGPKRLHILFSHLHLDHITGLVGFRPLHDPEAEIHLYGEAKAGVSFRGWLDRIFSPPYWPLGLKDFKAALHIHEIGPGERFSLAEGLTAKTLRSNHPNGSLIYRLEGGGRRVAYALDCELLDDMAGSLAAFIQGCGLLVWDANFIRADIKKGWGHSTWEQGAQLAENAGVKTVLMTHFSNDYADSFLRTQERLAAERSPSIRFAREGMEVTV